MKKLYCIGTLLLAGSFSLAACFGGRVKSGVEIDGIAVGGMDYAAAELLVREKIAAELPPLTIVSPAGDFTVRYPELSFTDDVSALVRGAARGEHRHSEVKRQWADAERFLQDVCEKNVRESKNAELIFTENGFEYLPEARGTRCDFGKLMRDVSAALRSGETRVLLSVGETEPAVTERDLRARTQLLSEFTTYFDGGNLPRSANIRLAASRISGTRIEPNGEFAFNAVVGKRTEENGFLPAAVILNGEFTTGVGGGVCQTSSTLFNAALLAGMKIEESHPHSLSVSYVPPSLDAMVSETSDLRFVNPGEFPVYLLSECGEGYVKFSFYGYPDGKRYETESSLLEKIPPPPPEEVEGEREEVLRFGKEGLRSESFLSVYGAEGELLSRTRIRSDVYSAIRGKIAVIREEVIPVKIFPRNFIKNSESR